MTTSRIDLTTLGWDAGWDQQFATLGNPALRPGRVVEEDKHWFRVVTVAGEVPAQVTGRLLHRRPSPAHLPKVGDWVACAPLAAEDKVLIHRVLPRRTQIVRKLAGRDVGEQVLATNIDVAFIVQALDQTFNPRRLERFLVMVNEGGAQPVVVLNKADLCGQLEARLAEAHTACGTAPLIVTCAVTGRGTREIASHVKPGRTAVFIGTSGVGKSSLINQLYGDPIQATLEVRERDAKGRHSTTWRELIPLPCGGLVIDTPGMREFHMWLASEGATFPDIDTLAAGCQFRNCSHTAEKGCAVLAAVAAGTLPRGRHESYVKLRKELEYLAVETRKHTYLTKKRGSGRPRPKERFGYDDD